MLRLVNVLLSFTAFAGVMACCCPCGPMLRGGLRGVNNNPGMRPPPIAQADGNPQPVDINPVKPGDGKAEDKKKTDKNPGDDPGDWQTVDGKDEQLAFSLRLPPDWKWEQKGKIHQAIKEAEAESSTHLVISVDRSPFVSKKKLTPSALLKHAVKQAAGLVVGMPIVEQRPIKVGDVDAAWIVFQEKQPGKNVPVSVTILCLLQAPGADVVIQGAYSDVRPGKTAKDFEIAKAEYLKIVQTFRITSGK